MITVNDEREFSKWWDTYIHTDTFTHTAKDAWKAAIESERARHKVKEIRLLVADGPEEPKTVFVKRLIVCTEEYLSGDGKDDEDTKHDPNALSFMMISKNEYARLKATTEPTRGSDEN